MVTTHFFDVYKSRFKTSTHKGQNGHLFGHTINYHNHQTVKYV
jgi:hypothetical protein